MRRLLAVAMVFGAVTGAQAADMPDLPFLRGSFTDGLGGARVVNWQGFYVGGQASYGSTTSKLSPSVNADLQSPSNFRNPPGVNYLWPLLPTPHSNTTGFGGYFGYNSQWDDVVLSVEANYMHDGIRSTSDVTQINYNPDFSINNITHSNATVRLSDFGSVRLRGGYVMGCFLPYAFVGTGFGSQTVDRSVSAFPDPLSPPPPTTAASKTRLVYGYSAGAGVDVMLVAGLFMRAEYEYRRVTSDIETNINTVRLGLGYKF
jgi:opacity protein-like surface antigen